MKRRWRYGIPLYREPDLEAQQAVEIEESLTTLQEVVEDKRPFSEVRGRQKR